VHLGRQLGNGGATTDDLIWATPVATVYDKDGNPIAAGTLTFVEVAAGGGYHSIARTAHVAGVDTNQVFACGMNENGQVGDPDNTDLQIDFWTEVTFSNDVLGIGAGYYHSFAIMQEWADPIP
jgi:alpha-tubulin suppressor-like RCC1 family protein